MKDRLWARPEECLDIGTTSDPRRTSDSSETGNRLVSQGRDPRATTVGLPLLEARKPGSFWSCLKAVCEDVTKLTSWVGHLA